VLKKPLTASFIVGIISIGLSTFIRGTSGLFGALAAQLVVALFFAVTVLVTKISKNLDPITTLALALFSYFAKLLALGLLLWALGKFTDRDVIDRASFGATAIALAFAWLGGEIASFFKKPLHLTP
jgi:ATP synthase protein I